MTRKILLILTLVATAAVSIVVHAANPGDVYTEEACAVEGIE